MNLLLFESASSGHIQIPSGDSRYTHIKNVLKSKSGDVLSVGQLNGNIGTGRILAVEASEISIRIESLDQKPPKPVPVTLILALPRPPMLQRTLSAVASLGIKRIYLIQTNRVEKSFWNSHVLDPADIRNQLILGLEQGKDTILPEVHLKKRFKPFVEDELPGIAEDSLKVLAHPGENSKPCPADIRQNVTLVIGPEGGFVPFELDLLTKAGFQSVHLGERTLRVETAVTALVSRMMFLE